MKKTSFLFALLLLFAAQSYSQTLINRQILSRNISKPVDVKIWLPRNFSASKKYPVIYEMVYDHTNFIASTVGNFYSIPPCIVVHAEIEAGNEHYSSTELLGEGRKYYDFLKDELIPLVEKDYSASKFRIAMGMSQGADYTNYVFRNNPELFSAYALFATEYPINYKIDYTPFARKITEPKDYFIATGNDTPQRVDFAKTLYRQIGANSKISLQMYHYDRAEHSYVMLHALPDALSFIFRDYINLRKPNNENSYQYFKNLYSELVTKYGYEFDINGFTANYLDVLRETKDSTDILRLVDEFEPKFQAIDLFNIGYVLSTMGKYDEAEIVLKKSIQKLFVGNPRINLDAPYRSLALRVYDAQGKTELAFQTLEEGHEKIKNTNINLLYNIGKYAVDKNYKVQKGVESLLSYQQNSDKVEPFFAKPVDEINFLIAKGYFQLNKKAEAKIYLEKALKANPKNEEANKLFKELN